MSSDPEIKSPFATPETAASKPVASESTEDSTFPRSSAMQKSPQLSSVALTRMLMGMCFIPVATIMGLWYIMPPVAEGQLKCQFEAINLPNAAFYAEDYWERPKYEFGDLIVHNREDEDWTHLNIQVNKNYQIYDDEPIPAGSSKTYKLDRFVSRAGSRFQLQYNQLKSARIYARRPGGKRATYYCEFKDGKSVEIER